MTWTLGTMGIIWDMEYTGWHPEHLQKLSWDLFLFVQLTKPSQDQDTGTAQQGLTRDPPTMRMVLSGRVTRLGYHLPVGIVTGTV